jgi:hypothetical protein
MVREGGGTSLPDVDHARRGGLKKILIGIPLLVGGGVLYSVAEEWLVTTFGTREGDSLVLTIPGKLVFVMMLPALAGYVLLMMGLYAAIFGERGQEQSFGWSLFRILFGLGATLGLAVVAIMLYGWLRRL